MKQQNFDSEFENLIREKITGDQQDPESILWKRLQDQMRYNDELARNKKRRFFILSSALVVISMSVGMLIGNVKWVGKKDSQHAVALKLKGTGKKSPNGKSHTHASIEITPTQKKSSNASIVPVQPSMEHTNVHYVQQTTDRTEDPQGNAVFIAADNAVTNASTTEDNPITDKSPIAAAQLSDQNDGGQQTTVSGSTGNPVSIPEETPSQEIVLPFQHVEAKQDRANTVLDVIPTAVLGKLSLTMNLSPDYVYRSARDHSSGTLLNAAYFNAAESGKVVMNGGLGAIYSLTPLFSVKGGVQLATYQTAYSVSNQLVFTDTVAKFVQIESAYGQMQLPESNFQNAGPQNPDEEEPTQVDTASIMLTYTNAQTLRMVQVPLALEFGVQQGKLRYIAGVGLTYGYLTSAHADFVANGFTPIRSDVRSLFNRNSLSGALHFGVEYAILPKLSVRATPSFTYMLTKMNRMGTISTHGFWGGIDLGLRFNL